MRAHWEPWEHVSQDIWDPCSQSSCWEKMLSVDYYSLCRGATLSPKGHLGHPPIRTILSWLGKGKRTQQLVRSETSVLRQESRGSGKSSQPTQHHFLSVWWESDESGWARWTHPRTTAADCTQPPQPVFASQFILGCRMTLLSTFTLFSFPLFSYLRYSQRRVVNVV